jgi:hypothetical protein
MKPGNLAFRIINDLLNIGAITDGIRPSIVQSIVQRRLNLDPRFRDETIHLISPAGDARCGQSGSVVCSGEYEVVTCAKCRRGYGDSIWGKSNV